VRDCTYSCARLYLSYVSNCTCTRSCMRLYLLVCVTLSVSCARLYLYSFVSATVLTHVHECTCSCARLYLPVRVTVPIRVRGCICTRPHVQLYSCDVRNCIRVLTELYSFMCTRVRSAVCVHLYVFVVGLLREMLVLNHCTSIRVY
jgi:hypothetical protein